MPQKLRNSSDALQRNQYLSSTWNFLFSYNHFRIGIMVYTKLINISKSGVRADSREECYGC